MRIIGLVVLTLLFIASFALTGCAGLMPSAYSPGDVETELVITSSAFAEGAEIPARYTCDGKNASPPLEWSNVPDGTNSFALILEDPSSPVRNFTHWVIFNLPSDTRSLPEDVPDDEELTSGALQGECGIGIIGYFGPCPPEGYPHHYCFTLYALDTSLDLAAGASKGQVLQAMEGHILAQGRLIGIYSR